MKKSIFESIILMNSKFTPLSKTGGTISKNVKKTLVLMLQANSSINSRFKLGILFRKKFPKVEKATIEIFFLTFTLLSNHIK